MCGRLRNCKPFLSLLCSAHPALSSSLEIKLDVGLSTNFLVVQMQRDLKAAQDVELRAILDYQRALIEFDRTQRTSLGAAGITVVGGRQ